MHKTVTSFTHKEVILCMQGDSCEQSILKVINLHKLHRILATLSYQIEPTSSS